jgi:hypothetical protein
MKHYRLTNGTMAKLHNEARFSSKSFNLSQETKFYTRTKQQAQLQFVYLNLCVYGFM